MFASSQRPPNRIGPCPILKYSELLIVVRSPTAPTTVGTSYPKPQGIAPPNPSSVMYSTPFGVPQNTFR